MKEKKATQSKEENRKKQKQEEWSLSNCRRAADPAHHRGFNEEDEPCDDSRDTIIQEQGKNEKEEKD
ncbi:MAG: hypothetical protein JW932_06115 [Deltaproteobacteria bacterium]|nr:hypothetical protein [Deltaproteobacteria bacterium]